ncbi:MAG: hypothetical protein C5B50_24515 [Verrucomicrobia bacterium]|nr:MAG: hypothetical protein C5B50_24515 [Verrucomicrobiota bacterium]
MSTAPAETAKLPPRVKRRLKIILLVLLAPWVLLLLFLLEEHFRGKISLAHYKRQLIAKGEKLTVAEINAQKPTGENGAPEIMAAIKELQEDAILPKYPPPAMKLTPAGRAVVCFREGNWLEGTETNDWDQLASEIATNRATLDRIRVALQMPVLDNNLDFSQGINMSFSHLAPTKSLARWFGAEAQLALNEGELHDALEPLVAQIRTARLVAEDRIIISQLVLLAIAAIARTEVWEALQAEGWHEEDLARLQQAWEGQNIVATLLSSLEGERVFMDSEFPVLRRSNEDTFKTLFGLEEYLPPDDSERPRWERAVRKLPWGEQIAAFFKQQIYCRVWRFAWLDQDNCRALERMQWLLDIARAAVAQKSFGAARHAIDVWDTEASNRNLYDRLRFPEPISVTALSGVVKRSLRIETERSIVISSIALKRYDLSHGKSPASLDSLAPEFLSSVPTDYLDGKPIKYHLNQDGSFTLYSVGDDGKDDGGDPSLLPGKTNLQILWDRKDFVWPAPALPEEIEAYRKEMQKN